MKDLLTALRVASGGPEEIPEGKSWCPGCKRIYTPDYPSPEESPPEERVAREQHISGMCSQECWDRVTMEDLED